MREIRFSSTSTGHGTGTPAIREPLREMAVIGVTNFTGTAPSERVLRRAQRLFDSGNEFVGVNEHRALGYYSGAIEVLRPMVRTSREDLSNPRLARQARDLLAQVEQAKETVDAFLLEKRD